VEDRSQCGFSIVCIKLVKEPARSRDTVKLSSISRKAYWPKSSVTSKGYLDLDISARNLEVFAFICI